MNLDSAAVYWHDDGWWIVLGCLKEDINHGRKSISQNTHLLHDQKTTSDNWHLNRNGNVGYYSSQAQNTHTTPQKQY